MDKIAVLIPCYNESKTIKNNAASKNAAYLICAFDESQLFGEFFGF